MRSPGKTGCAIAARPAREHANKVEMKGPHDPAGGEAAFIRNFANRFIIRLFYGCNAMTAALSIVESQTSKSCLLSR
jgi:hypothetical protein